MSYLDPMPPPLGLPVGFDPGSVSPQDTRAAVLALGQADDDVLRSWSMLIEYLLAVGRTDIPLAKLVEGHLDALRIHQEAGTKPVPDAAYGVWASRSRATGLTALRHGDSWVLDGTLAFASGAGVVDRALVPVWPDEQAHVLLDLDVTQWGFDTSSWRTRAMQQSRTARVTLSTLSVRAAQVGGASFYLGRPGFFPGGVGVAAVWAGGAARVADLLEFAVPAHRRSTAQHIRVGRIRAEIAALAAICRDYARSGRDHATEPRIGATLVRAAVAAGARRILDDARSVAGAVGLALDGPLTCAIDDLTLYLAQQNADADAEWLGSR